MMTVNTGSLVLEHDDREPPATAPRFRVAKAVGWVALAFVALMVFTVAKLPDDRISGYANAAISAALSPREIGFKAAKSGIRIGWGLAYELEDVTLTPPLPEMPIRIDRVRLSPSIWSFIPGWVAASARVEARGGVLDASFRRHGQLGAEKSSFAFDASKIDLGKLGVIPLLAGIRGGGMIDGSGSVTLDTATPSASSGAVQLALTRAVIDSQTLQGFTLPRLQISEGKVDLEIREGKIQFKNFKLGKPGDDLVATLTGDIALARNWDLSVLNLRANFTISDTVRKAFSLIDALLASSKQPDGSFSYRIAGTLASPQPTPDSSR